MTVCRTFLTVARSCRGRLSGSDHIHPTGISDSSRNTHQTGGTEPPRESSESAKSGEFGGDPPADGWRFRVGDHEGCSQWASALHSESPLRLNRASLAFRNNHTCSSTWLGLLIGPEPIIRSDFAECQVDGFVKAELAAFEIRSLELPVTETRTNMIDAALAQWPVIEQPWLPHLADEHFDDALEFGRTSPVGAIGSEAR